MTYAVGQLIVNRHTAVVLQKRGFSLQCNSFTLFSDLRSVARRQLGWRLYLYLVLLNEFQMAYRPVICQYICYC